MNLSHEPSCVPIMELLIIATGILGFYLFQIHKEKQRLERSLKKYESLSSQEEYQRELDIDISSKRQEISALNEDYELIASKYSELCSQEELEDYLATDIKSKKQRLSQLTGQESEILSRIEDLKKQTGELEEEKELQSFGFYQPKYDFISAGNYSSQLHRIKASQKKMVKENEAVICDTEWTIQGSEKEGRKMVTNFQKLILTVFNADCDSFISKLKHSSNVLSVEAKISKKFDNLNKRAKVIRCEIDKRYLKLKLKELHLQYQVKCEQQEEKERQKAIREQTRERKKIEKHLKAAEEAEEREHRFQQELENALKEQELSHGVEKERLERQVLQLRQNLEKARSDKDRANEQAALEKAGYIYVISNIGSLGRNIYRICMTKKSGDPDDYVNAMAPATPFPFDIHLKFVSENALETLTELHQTFANTRVNKARSERKGFFQVSLEEIINTVEEIKQKTGHIKGVELVSKAPPAYDYRRSQAIERREKEKVKSQDFEINSETA